jgi:hypothetical protein
LEKAIRFEKLNPNLKIDSHEQMLVELNRIVEKVAFKNNIPLDTFKRFLKILRSLRIYLRFYGFGEGKLTNTKNKDIIKGRRLR